MVLYLTDTVTSLLILGIEGYSVFMCFLLNRYIKHLKWMMTGLMDQVMERNHALKCRDEKKDRRGGDKKSCHQTASVVTFLCGLCLLSV